RAGDSASLRIQACRYAAWRLDLGRNHRRLRLMANRRDGKRRAVSRLPCLRRGSFVLVHSSQFITSIIGRGVMSKRFASMSRRPLAAALFVALVAPGMAFAETAKEKELEARVAHLEQQIQALLSSQQQQQTVIAETRAQVTEVKTA